FTARAALPPLVVVPALLVVVPSPLVLLVDRLHSRARDAENRDFGRVDDRRERRAADAAQIRDAERAALPLLERQFAAARLLGELRQLDGDLDDVLGVGVANDRHKEAAIRIDGDADVHVLLEDDLLGGEIDRRIELWKHF